MMIISSGLLPAYFGSLGFCYFLVFGCMLFFQWRKRIHQRQRAKAWVKQLKAETYFQHALSHRADKEALPETKAQVCNPTPHKILQPQDNFSSNEATTERSDNSNSSFPDSDPCKPVFQEIPCACALSYLPPLLEHSASYPCSSIPVRSTAFSSLKSAALKNESYNTGSSISA
ncbi:testis-expressed protein 38 [Sceloporus undulatus]|uniref:testis-expressed protein 38 n=1 Tax=Sceloporus undulatus TaxID=8520 RepID=UPI001C4DD567|nr:testis-expressed protein 38 [Sceloporus undulatus]